MQVRRLNCRHDSHLLDFRSPSLNSMCACETHVHPRPLPAVRWSRRVWHKSHGTRHHERSALPSSSNTWVFLPPSERITAPSLLGGSTGEGQDTANVAIHRLHNSSSTLLLQRFRCRKCAGHTSGSAAQPPPVSPGRPELVYQKA